MTENADFCPVIPGPAGIRNYRTCRNENCPAVPGTVKVITAGRRKAREDFRADGALLAPAHFLLTCPGRACAGAGLGCAIAGLGCAIAGRRPRPRAGREPDPRPGAAREPLPRAWAAREAA